MLTLTDPERSRLAELMGADSVAHYEALVLDHVESTGKRYKSLAATIRVWYRRDLLKTSKSAFDRPATRMEPPKPKETPTERQERATAILQQQIRENNRAIARGEPPIYKPCTLKEMIARIQDGA